MGIQNSGADGIRTHDLRIANATLSQLSYGPVLCHHTENSAFEKSVAIP